MGLFRAACMVTVLSLGSTAAWATEDGPLDHDEIHEHATDPIVPSFDAFKSGVLWSLFGAGFVGAWGGLVAGTVAGLVTLAVGVLGGIAYGFSGGAFAGAASRNLVLVPVLAVLGAGFGLVFGLIWGIIAGIINAVVAGIVGTLVAALAGSLGFGILGVIIHVAQQWLARVPFGHDGGRTADRGDAEAAPAPTPRPPPRALLPGD